MTLRAPNSLLRSAWEAGEALHAPPPAGAAPLQRGGGVELPSFEALREARDAKVCAKRRPPSV